MPVEALCPTCGAVFNLKDEFQGKKVRCKKCEQVFTVGGAAKEREEDEGVQSKPGAAPAKKGARDDDDDRSAGRKSRPAAKRGGDDDDDDRPRKSASRRGRDDDDDDDDSPKRKRVYHDDDDDDDDRPRKRAAGGGGSGMMIAIIAGVAVLLLAVIGGGIYGVYKLLETTEEVVDDVKDKAQAQNNNPFNGGGNPVFFPPPDFGGRQPADLKEALDNLKPDKAVADRGAAANWLAREKVDPGRKREVAQALEALVKDPDDNLCAAGASALKVWGSKDNGEALATALKHRLPDQAHQFFTEAQKQLMGAIAQFKYEPGAEAIAEFLPNGGASDEAEKALGTLGPGAEKAVVKFIHHPDGGTHDRARRLLRRFATKPAVILDQTVADLGSPDRNQAKTAAEWLSNDDSNDALNAAKADAARAKSVAVALNPLIDDPPQWGEGAVANALKRWATKDNAASLVRALKGGRLDKRAVVGALGQTKDPAAVPALAEVLSTDFGCRGDAANALIAIGPACQAEVTKLLSHQDRGVVGEAERVLNAVSGGKGDFKLVKALADLKSGDNGRLNNAGSEMQKIPVDEKKRAEVVAALVDALKDTGVGKGDFPAENVAKALAVWASKDDAPAVVDKVKEMHKFFAGRSRRVLFEWMGTAKVEKAIPFLVTSLADKDDWQTASRALQAMGPDLGATIEVEMAKVPPNDKNLLLEEIKILEKVGTKNSLKDLNKTKALNAKDFQVARACQDAIDAINLRANKAMP